MVVINNKTYSMTNGSRAQVLHGTAYKTSGGLRDSDLKMNKHGRIVSKRMSMSAKKNNRLVNAGWVTKKGEFGSYQTDSKSPKKGSVKKGKKKGSKKK